MITPLEAYNNSIRHRNEEAQAFVDNMLPFIDELINSAGSKFEVYVTIEGPLPASVSRIHYSQYLGVLHQELLGLGFVCRRSDDELCISWSHVEIK